jgi:predicted RNA-binding protein with PIN domain
VVVSSDRDIADFVSRRGGTAVSSQEFEALIDRVKDRMPDTQPRSDAGHDKGEDDVREGVKRKGPSRRLSRKKKAAIVKLRKL